MMGESKMIVAAIDFGTTFSSYAFSFKHDYARDPAKIHIKHWTGGYNISLKAPTSVLFDKNQTFHSFGYEAEDKFSELADDDEHKDWFFFRQFKMLLHNNTSLTRDTLVQDENQRSFPALTVFMEAVRYLKDDAIEKLMKQVPEVSESDVMWVLTVPAIWNESAKQFMREAAEKAGIRGENLKLALEPEAASVLCKCLPVNCERGGIGSTLDVFRPGTSYIVIDLGGGTVDITVHKVSADGSLNEIKKASGGAWGGTKVDKAFIDFLEDIAGKDVVEKFRNESKSDFIEMMREFEIKKRKIKCASTGKITLRIGTTLGQIFEQINTISLDTHLQEIGGSERVSYKNDKLHLDSDTMKSFFEYAVSKTVNHILDLFSEDELKMINDILLVGGFAESEFVQERIRGVLKEKRVIIPSESGLVVLKGAVIYGHEPSIIKARSCKYTYGVEVIDRFIDGENPEEYKIYDPLTDTYKCRYTFEPFVRAGDVLSVNHTVTNEYTTDIIDVTEGVGIYASTRRNPEYVVEPDCFKVGSIILDKPRRRVSVEMQFGGTEFTVQITDIDSKEKKINCFDFLRH